VKADRFYLQDSNYLDGDQINALDFLNQTEAGYKQGFDNGAVHATVFMLTREEAVEATSNRCENDYKSRCRVRGPTADNLNLRGGVTYTNAEIDSGNNAGKTPRRQPDFIYKLHRHIVLVRARNNVELSFI
jgi:hypothetical protein